MLLRVITIATLLVLLIQQIQGFYRIVVVNESGIYNNEDIFKGNNSTFNAFEFSCCTYGNCSCPSLHCSLANLTSNVLINITTDVELLSVIQLFNLVNVTIIGHNYPTVNCNNSGGLYFVSCYYCAIEGITWEGCGARNHLGNSHSDPVLKLFNSSNIIIKNCSFQYSIGQVVVLSGVSRNVSIIYCKFSSNKQYEGHGTAIHYIYSSNNTLLMSPSGLMISRCNFFYNKRAESVVHFGQSSTELSAYLHLQDCNFYYNEAVPIYLTNQNLCINGNIKFYKNIARNGGGIFVTDYSNVTFHKSATIIFTYNTAKYNGGAIFIANQSSIIFKDNPTDNEQHDSVDDHLQCNSHFKKPFIMVKFNCNIAKRFGKDIYVHNSIVIFGNSAKVKFSSGSSGSSAIYTNYYSFVTFEGNSIATFNDNSDNGAVNINGHSTITFKGNSMVAFNNNSADYNGGAIIISDYSIITIKENSTATFNNNSAKFAGALSINSHSTVICDGNSVIIFNNNIAEHCGGAVSIETYANAIFQGSTAVKFNNNYCAGRTTGPGALFINVHSTFTFKGNSAVKFNSEYKDDIVLVFVHSTVTFKESSVVIFNNNNAESQGDSLYISTSSTVMVTGNSTVTFNHHSYGRRPMFIDHSTVTFEENSKVTFNDNGADENGVAVYIYRHSTVMFKGNSIVTFNSNYNKNNNNNADDDGTVYIEDSKVTFDGNSVVTFNNNSVDNGGALYIHYYSIVTVQGNSTVKFSNNSAKYLGGAVCVCDFSHVSFKGNCTVTFNNNNANSDGGAVVVNNNSTIIFYGNSTITFSNNNADNYGGAVVINKYSIIKFCGNSAVTFNNNRVHNDGGAVFMHYYSTIIFKGNATVIFNVSTAANNGGAIYIDHYSVIITKENSTVAFNKNTAANGGTVYIKKYSTFTVEENSTARLTYCNNKANNNGGTFFIDHSAAQFKGKSKIIFYNNSANFGGTAVAKSSQIIIERNSFVDFTGNTALQDGGVIYLSDHSEFTHCNGSYVTFHNNIAGDYGGAIYALFDHSTINFSSYDIQFKDNIAGKIQKALYINVIKSCNSSCLFQNINIITK